MESDELRKLIICTHGNYLVHISNVGLRDTRAVTEDVNVRQEIVGEETILERTRARRIMKAQKRNILERKTNQTVEM